VPIDIQRLRALVRDIPDFPKPGIVFKDITPLLANEVAFSSVIDETVVHFGRGNVDKVVGIEARGFILASPVAYHFGAGFLPVRKAGKLPYQVEAEEYALEYGTATLELHADAVVPGERVLIVDDVLATGGTARAAARTTSRPWPGSGSRSRMTRSGRARCSTVEVQAWKVTVARLAR